VSTDCQEKGLQSQEMAIQAYLDAHGIQNATWYRDRVSGKDMNRPQLMELKAAIARGEITCVIVWKIDRLSRNLRDGIVTLADFCDHGCRFISVTQGFDLSGAMGRMLSAVMLGIAEMELETIRENTRRGMQLAKARGAKLGRRHGAWINTIKPMLEQGATVAEIAVANGKTRQAVYSAMKFVEKVSC
jgi:DNA invertase Pin-like site-specific DNA recombinase